MSIVPKGNDALRAMATQIRRDSVRMINEAGAGHPGGALGAAEVFAALYGRVMKVDPDRLDDPDRDRLVLSNGHICAAYYSALSLRGFLPREELSTFRRLDSRLQGHPAREKLPGIVETSTGPLGQGFSVANGLALGLRLDGRSARVHCIVGDGEMQEGQVWEALMTAAQYKLSNLCLIISYNGLQIDGEVDRIKHLEPLAARLTAFGWHVVEVDGHDMDGLLRAFEAASTETARPTALLARTVMGKGAPFMEGKAAWHGSCPNKEQTAEALAAFGTAVGYDDYPSARSRS